MSTWFIFDVESIGLYGEAFAVAGLIVKDGETLHEFSYVCPRYAASGHNDDRTWVEINVPMMESNFRSPVDVRDAFWKEWIEARAEHRDIQMAADCLYPVESRFITACIKDYENIRKWSGPYPFVDIGSIMLAAGMSPLAEYPRLDNELPVHNPLADARQSARLLLEALSKVTQTNTRNEETSEENRQEDCPCRCCIEAPCGLQRSEDLHQDNRDPVLQERADT